MDPVSQASVQSTLAVPTGEEVYDALMGAIEPELLSANIPHLDEAYASESEEDRQKRYERYSAAFATYDEAFAKWERELNEAVSTYRRDALKSAEEQNRMEEKDALARIEQDFDSVLTS